MPGWVCHSCPVISFTRLGGVECNVFILLTQGPLYGHVQKMGGRSKAVSSCMARCCVNSGYVVCVCMHVFVVGERRKKVVRKGDKN